MSVQRIKQQPRYGERRFNCDCGWTGVVGHDGGAEALAWHFGMAHDVRIEQYRQGHWYYVADCPRLADLVITRLRANGESVAAFMKRLETATEALRRRALARTEESL